MDLLDKNLKSRVRSESCCSTVSSSTSNLSSNSGKQKNVSIAKTAAQPVSNSKHSFRNVARTIMLAGIFLRKEKTGATRLSREKYDNRHYSWHRDYHSKNYSLPEFDHKGSASEICADEIEARKKKRLERVPAISEEMQKVVSDLGQTHLFPEIKDSSVEETESVVSQGKKRRSVKRKDLNGAVRKTVLNPNKFIQSTQEAVRFSHRHRTFRQIGEKVVRQQNTLRAWQDLNDSGDKRVKENKDAIEKVSSANRVRVERPQRVVEAWSVNNLSHNGIETTKDIIEKYLNGSMAVFRNDKTENDDSEGAKQHDTIGQKYFNHREDAVPKHIYNFASDRRSATPRGNEFYRHGKLIRSRTLSTESERLVYAPKSTDSTPRTSGMNSAPRLRRGVNVGSARERKLLRSRTLSSESETRVFGLEKPVKKEELEFPKLDLLSLEASPSLKVTNGRVNSMVSTEGIPSRKSTYGISKSGVKYFTETEVTKLD